MLQRFALPELQGPARTENVVLYLRRDDTALQERRKALPGATDAVGATGTAGVRITCRLHKYVEQPAPGEKDAAGFGSNLQRWYQGAGGSGCPGPPAAAHSSSGLSENGFGAAITAQDCCFKPQEE